METIVSAVVDRRTLIACNLDTGCVFDSQIIVTVNQTGLTCLVVFAWRRAPSTLLCLFFVLLNIQHAAAGYGKYSRYAHLFFHFSSFFSKYKKM